MSHTRGEPVLWKVGLALVLAGFALAVIAALLPLLAAPGAQVGVGGCIIVLFVPVCFGVGSQALPLLIVAIALSIVLLVVAFIVRRVLAREVHQVA